MLRAMPKRSAAHLSQRRDQILDAALGCFIQEGFHKTSMADVIAASGLSAGSVYRYFPSKRALIRACAEVYLAQVGPGLTAMADQQPPASPAEAIGAIVRTALDVGQQRGIELMHLGVAIWAESTRDPELRALLHAYYSAMRAQLATLVRAWQTQAGLPPGMDPDAFAGVLFALAPGFVVQSITLGDDALELEPYVEAIQELILARSQRS
jgi:AcrR family transcriptional regulator